MCPAKLVFVSFLRSQHAEGQMVKDLEARGFRPIKFKLDNHRPDLAKLDNLFGLLSSDSVSFEEQIEKMRSNIMSNGMKTMFEKVHT